MNKRLIIAIDGPSGAGKSTISKLLAERLNYIYIDTGAMYRAVAYSMLKRNIDIEDDDTLFRMCTDIDISFCKKNDSTRIILNSKDITQDIRSPGLSMLASDVSAKKAVRDALLQIQRKMGEGGGVVIEGRDIGTVVFPNADIKIYLDAIVEERGKRRYKELLAKGEDVTLEDVTKEIIRRDRNDSLRKLAPLKPARGAYHIDSTNITIDEVIKKILGIIGEFEGC
ncbi:MAG: (d)CMP kinase [Thermodesulfobacteriota bacterium]|nr:(d)CMP kinase [Thermodesulfobacteriota bacterium]